MEDYNRITLIWTVSKAPQFKEVQGKFGSVQFWLRVSELKKNSKWEEQEFSTFLNINFFWIKWKAQGVLNTVKENKRYFVEGRIANVTYEKDWEKKTFTNIMASKVIPLEEIQNTAQASNEPPMEDFYY